MEKAKLPVSVNSKGEEILFVFKSKNFSKDEEWKTFWRVKKVINNIKKKKY